MNNHFKYYFLQQTEQHLPSKISKNFSSFQADERNNRGETLIMSVVKYEPDLANQVRGF